MTVGYSKVEKQLTRGCPQGSQLGPILWNASMERTLAIHKEDNTKIIAYADDILVMVAASRTEIIQRRAALVLNRLIELAVERDLTSSPSKTTALSVKGGVKPIKSVRFGDTLDNNESR